MDRLNQIDHNALGHWLLHEKMDPESVLRATGENIARQQFEHLDLDPLNAAIRQALGIERKIANSERVHGVENHSRRRQDRLVEGRKACAQVTQILRDLNYRLELAIIEVYLKSPDMQALTPKQRHQQVLYLEATAFNDAGYMLHEHIIKVFPALDRRKELSLRLDIWRAIWDGAEACPDFRAFRNRGQMSRRHWDPSSGEVLERPRRSKRQRDP